MIILPDLAKQAQEISKQYNIPVNDVFKQLQTMSSDELTAALEEGLNNYNYSSTDTNYQDYSNVINYQYSDIDSEAITGVNNANFSKSGILGLPFQFNAHADPRIGDNSLGAGRTFKTKILADMPLVIFQIGKPEFMQEVSSTLLDGNSEKQAGDTIVRGLTTVATGVEDSLETVLDSAGFYEASDALVNNTRYYGFKDDFTRYCSYVNTMCRYVAIKMGLADKYRDFKIQNQKESTFFTKVTGNSNYIAIYGSNVSYSESGSNSTGQSQIASALKSISDVQSELAFLLNGNGVLLDKFDMSSYNEQIESNFGFIEQYSSGLFTKVKNAIDTIASGGNLLFPEIWNDSNFSKSYSLDLKLVSPYGTPESIFLNLYVPLFCILGMALPRHNSVQGYGSPFLIKAYSKGWFNCDMGMIDTISISKDGPWTVEGLPTSMDISISFKDLYTTMMMTLMSTSNMIFFSNNTGFLEYLTCLTGIEMHGINFSEGLTRLNLIIGEITSIPGNIVDSAAQGIYNALSSISRRFFGNLN